GGIDYKDHPVISGLETGSRPVDPFLNGTGSRSSPGSIYPSPRIAESHENAFDGIRNLLMSRIRTLIGEMRQKHRLKLLVVKGPIGNKIAQAIVRKLSEHLLHRIHGHQLHLRSRFPGRLFHANTKVLLHQEKQTSR